MKNEELRDMSRRQLAEQLEASQKRLNEVRFQLETRKSKQHHQVPEIKKDIARMKTALRERELLAAYGGVEVADEDELPTARTEEAPRRRSLFGLGRRGR